MRAETGGGDDALKARFLLDVAQKLKANTLFLTGAKDDRTDPDQARRLAETISAYGGAGKSYRLSAVRPIFRLRRKTKTLNLSFNKPCINNLAA